MPCAVIVMAKAPVPGQVKTRLAPALGAPGAAALAECLLARALESALRAGIGPVEVCCAPDAAHPAFRRLADWDGVQLAEQGEGDIGQRMHRALRRVLATQPSALLIGTDLPGLQHALLRRAAQALQAHDAVFVPARDGGYGLVGLKRPQPALFEGIAWSTPDVMSRTRERLAAAGLTHAELDPLPDLDRPEDLAHLEWRT